MRSRLFSFCLSAIAGLLFLGLFQVSAQTGTLIRFQLPESVLLAGTELRAGTYTAQPYNLAREFPMLLVESEHGLRMLVPVRVTDAQKHDSSARILLQRSDGVTRLTGFQFEGEPTSFTVIGH